MYVYQKPIIALSCTAADNTTALSCQQQLLQPTSRKLEVHLNAPGSSHHAYAAQIAPSLNEYHSLSIALFQN